MKLLDLRVEWNLQWSNEPRLELLLGEKPKREDLRYDKHLYVLYFAEKDGFVDFYSYKRPGGGYGGRHFPIKLVDGSEETLIGPWSSRSSVMNMYGFPHCMEVAWTEEQDTWKRGHTFTAGAVTIEWLKAEMSARWPHLEIRLRDKVDCPGYSDAFFREPMYVPALKGLSVPASKQLVKGILTDSLSDEGSRWTLVQKFGGHPFLDQNQGIFKRMREIARTIDYAANFHDEDADDEKEYDADNEAPDFGLFRGWTPSK